MIIFHDLLTGDEMFSDTFKYEEVEDGLLYRVIGAHVSEKTTISDSMIGGNASAEGQGEDEAADGAVVNRGINIALYHKLESAPMAKKDYKPTIKDYCGRLVKKLKELGKDDEAKAFQKSASKFIPKLLSDYDSYETYMVSSYDVNAQLPLLKWEDNETVPVMFFFKAGLVGEKV